MPKRESMQGALCHYPEYQNATSKTEEAGFSAPVNTHKRLGIITLDHIWNERRFTYFEPRKGYQ